MCLTPFWSGTGRWRKSARNASTNGATTSRPQCSTWERWILLNSQSKSDNALCWIKLTILRRWTSSGSTGTRKVLNGLSNSSHSWRLNKLSMAVQWAGQQTNNKVENLWNLPFYRFWSVHSCLGSLTCTCMSRPPSSGPTWRQSDSSSPSTCSTRRWGDKHFF